MTPATPAQTDGPLKRILLVQPRYDMVEPTSRDAFWNCLQPESELETVALREIDCDVERLDVGGSALTDVFNKSWAIAGDLWEAGLIDGYAMVHADLQPEAGFLSVLHREMLRVGADAIATHNAIKTKENLSSTAVDVGRDPWKTPRLTMRQVHALPETITDADVGGPLLLNTGCWLCRLGPWMDEVLFRVWNRIEKRNGKREALFQAEDWDFSRQMHDHGLRLAATRKVKTLHYGKVAYGNQAAETGWAVDEINGDALAGLKRPFARLERTSGEDLVGLRERLRDTPVPTH